LVNIWVVEMSEDNTIYIGRKPVMSYVMATLATFNNDHETVHLKARGRAITTAVDVAEITRNRYMVGMEKPEITIGTEVVEDNGSKRNVSTITITLRKGEAEVPEDVFKGKRAKEAAPAKEAGETLEVSSIKGVGPVTEEKLKLAGYDTVAKIAGAEAFELALKTGISEGKVSAIIESAKELLESV